MFHFGGKDPHDRPRCRRQGSRTANFGAHRCHVYEEAGHGFNRVMDTRTMTRRRRRNWRFSRSAWSSSPSYVKPAKLDQGPYATRIWSTKPWLKVKTVSIEEAKGLAWTTMNVVFVDIRDPREVSPRRDHSGRLAGARAACSSSGSIRPARITSPNLIPDRQYLFFCAAAWRSALATSTIQDMGVLPNVAHLDGGFGGWRTAGLPIEEQGKESMSNVQVLSSARNARVFLLHCFAQSRQCLQGGPDVAVERGPTGRRDLLISSKARRGHAWISRHQCDGRSARAGASSGQGAQSVGRHPRLSRRRSLVTFGPANDEERREISALDACSTITNSPPIQQHLRYLLQCSPGAERPPSLSFCVVA